MKILLVGEYSRLHNSLKEGLVKKGHEVVIIGGGDFFKKLPVDLKIRYRYEKGLGYYVMRLAHRLFNIDLKSRSIKKQVLGFGDQLKGFDVVQLINESPFGASPRVTKEIIGFLKDNNKRMFLLSCGTDHLSVKYGFAGHFRYSIFTPLFEGKVTERAYGPILKYLDEEHKELHKFVFERIEGVIASDIDYHIPLKGHPKYLGLIPNPVNTDIIEYKPLKVDGKIVIFHGINRENYYKKGSDYFEAALQVVGERYPDRVEIITAESLPYSEYIALYDRAHILLDQVLGYDQGYNALEAMAKGKVVFTGAETEFEAHYGLNNKVAVNVLPEKLQIVGALEECIQNPERLKEISKAARSFVENEHHYVKIAEKYLETWNANEQ